MSRQDVSVVATVYHRAPTTLTECIKSGNNTISVKILILPGDGIGPEITEATIAVLDRANALHGLGLEWEYAEMGFATLRKEGTTLPARVLERARETASVILGPISHNEYPPREQGGINPSAEFRVKLDLYANIRPARSRLGVGLTGKPVDLVIFRECTEGFYADRNMHPGLGEFMPTEDMAIAVRRVTTKCCNRIARRAFEMARTRRRKVTAVHKANVLRVSDALFLREVRKVAADFPEIELEETIVDATTALLLRDPMRFDVIVTGNMFGDILSDEASELSGSLGLAGSVNAGDDLCVAQAQHGSAPDIQGQDKANPTSLILSAAMLLEWLGRRHGMAALTRAGKEIDAAIDVAVKNPATRTPDLGGAMGTKAFGRHVASLL
jgi:3-isopropylmalate dehydrogenase